MTTRITSTVLPLIAGLMLLLSSSVGSAARAAPGSFGGERAATAPVSLAIPNAAVDAAVERNQIVDGMLRNPSGPWVVSWYEETGLLGDVGNTVLSGHVDYWEVGPAVFWNLKDLAEGAMMQVHGENGVVYVFAVEWVRTYAVTALTPETIRETIGPTDYQAITLITCGGEFNHETGAYLSRTLVRGKLVATAQEMTSAAAK